VLFFDILTPLTTGATTNMFSIREFLGLGYYTSSLDEFLASFRKAHPKLSTSQCKEIEKYKRISILRDNPIEHIPKKQFWNQF
jgi:hypothetical protein